VSHAERRLREVEERLRDVEAPGPPPRLLESLVREIPETLGAGEEAAPGGASRWRRWRLLAASLAVVVAGGALGYRLLREAPVERSVEPRSAEPRSVEPAAPRAEAPVPGSDQPRGVDDAPGTAAPTGRVDAVEVLPGDEGGKRVVAPGPPIPAAPAPEEVREENVAAGDAGQGTREIGERAGDPLDRAREQLRDRLSALAAEGGLERAAPSPPAAAPPAAAVEASPEVPLAPPAVVQTAPQPDATAAAAAPRPGRDGEFRGRLDALKVGQEAFEVEPAGGRAGSQAGFDEAPTRRWVPPSTGGTVEPNDRPYGDMFFQGYGTNPFVDTEDDPLSTFAVDVDTASYELARGYLRRGHLPPADAVRVEEFVNSFDYGDPPPRRRDFAVVAEGAPSPFAATARTYLVRFALKGREVAASHRRPAVLTFVVDVSGSMNRENRLGLVKRSLGLLVDELDAGDAVGLVVYGSRGQVLLAPTGDYERVLAAIDRLRPGGSTNAEEGLALGYETARRHFRDGAINRVILCSDGVANVGATGPDTILRRIAEEAAAGIELTAVGFGMGNYNDVLMEQLADRGDGNYAYVDDVETARRVFVENLTGTLQTIAADAKVQVEFDPGQVQSYRLLGYENRDVADRDFRNDAVDAGEIGAGHQVTALYEVKLREGAPQRGDLATLRLRYRSRESGRIVEDAAGLGRQDLARSWSEAPRGLRVAAVVAEFAERLRGSYWARGTSLRELAAAARDVGRLGPWDSRLAELTELIEIAARLEGGGPAAEPDDRFER